MASHECHIVKLTNNLLSSFLDFIARNDFKDSTYLTNDLVPVKELVHLSHQSFNRVKTIGFRTYGFVLQDPQHNIRGVAFLNDYLPSKNYYWQLVDDNLQLSSLSKANGKFFGFYLEPSIRGKGYSKPLSIARLDYIRDNLEDFTHLNAFIAEIKGDKNFFDKIYSPFLSHNFNYYDQRRSAEIFDKEVLTILNSKYNNCIPFESVKDILGQVFKDSLPAFHQLMVNGFKPSDYFDILDGGLVLKLDFIYI